MADALEQKPVDHLDNDLLLVTEEKKQNCCGRVWTFWKESPKLQNGLEITGIVILIITSGAAIPGVLGIIGGTVGGSTFLAVIPGALTMPGVIALTAGGGVAGAATLALLLHLVINNCLRCYRGTNSAADGLEEIEGDDTEQKIILDILDVTNKESMSYWESLKDYSGPKPAYRIMHLTESNAYKVFIMTDLGPRRLPVIANATFATSSEARKDYKDVWEDSLDVLPEKIVAPDVTDESDDTTES